MDQNRNGTVGPINVNKFPEDIEAVPHKMVITIRTRTYTRGGGSITSSQITQGSNIGSAIVLPVPSNIIESYGANYNHVDLGVIGDAIAEVASRVTDGGFSATGDAIFAGVERITGVNFRGVDVLSRAGLADLASRAGQAAGNLGGAAAYQGAINLTSRATSELGFKTPVADAIAAGTGMIFNPHRTAIFSGVNIRAMQYNWTLAPKKEKESQSIERIVSILRNAMLPKRSSNALFLEFPNEVEYKILGPSQEYSMPTAPCVITQLNLNRTGAGEPAFFAKTGAPVIYTLSLGLLEVKALLRDDFENTQRPPSTPENPSPTSAPSNNLAEAVNNANAEQPEYNNESVPSFGNFP